MVQIVMLFHIHGARRRWKRRRTMQRRYSPLFAGITRTQALMALYLYHQCVSGFVQPLRDMLVRDCATFVQLIE